MNWFSSGLCDRVLCSDFRHVYEELRFMFTYVYEELCFSCLVCTPNTTLYRFLSYFQVHWQMLGVSLAHISSPFLLRIANANTTSGIYLEYSPLLISFLVQLYLYMLIVRRKSTWVPISTFSIITLLSMYSQMHTFYAYHDLYYAVLPFLITILFCYLTLMEVICQKNSCGECIRLLTMESECPIRDGRCIN